MAYVIEPIEIAQTYSLIEYGYFPLFKQYLERGGDFFFKDPFTHIGLFCDNVLVGIACVTLDRYVEQSFHISVVEVIESVQRKGHGTVFLQLLENLALEDPLVCKTTLQCKFSPLDPFYRKRGYVPNRVLTTEGNTITLYIKEFTRG